jgi:hypothetical protein
MKDGPWTSGPRELLDHAKDHLAKKTDVDNRFAMISVDNAVELMLNTYLTLPKRVTGLDLTRGQREEYTKYFATALSKLEELVPDRLAGVRLAEIEWFHRIRNQLYHEGNAITVEREKVEQYLKQGESLMRGLFPAGRGVSAGPRLRLPQDVFFEDLRAAVGPRDVPVAEHLLTDLRAMGVEARWGASGFSARLRTPIAPKPLLTILLVTTDGTAYVGWLAGQLKKLDLPRSIAHAYYESAASLFDDCYVKTQPSGDLGWTRSLRLSEIGGRYDEFMAILREAIGRIKTESQAIVQRTQIPAAAAPRTAREIIWAAVAELLSKPAKKTFTPTEVYQQILKTYPDFNRGTNNAQIIADCANCPSRRHFPGHKPDRYFNVERGVYRLYDPGRDGVWDQQGNLVDSTRKAGAG